MKSYLQRFAAGLLAAAILTGFNVARAANETNAVQRVNLRVTMLTQAPDTTSGANVVIHNVTKTVLLTKDIIQVIAADLNTAFPATAYLARVATPAGSGNVSYQIRQGTNVLADVSSYFNFTVKRGVQASRTNVTTTASSGKDYNFIEFTFNLGKAPNFDVFGLLTVSHVNVARGKVIYSEDEFDADDLAGTGADANGAITVVTASATAHGTTTQVLPIPVE